MFTESLLKIRNDNEIIVVGYFQQMTNNMFVSDPIHKFSPNKYINVIIENVMKGKWITLVSKYLEDETMNTQLICLHNSIKDHNNENSFAWEKVGCIDVESALAGIYDLKYYSSGRKMSKYCYDKLESDGLVAKYYNMPQPGYDHGKNEIMGFHNELNKKSHTNPNPNKVRSWATWIELNNYPISNNINNATIISNGCVSLCAPGEYNVFCLKNKTSNPSQTYGVKIIFIDDEIENDDDTCSSD